MKLLLVISSILLLAHIGGWVISDLNAVKSCHSLLEDGSPSRALRSCIRAGHVSLTFVDRRKVDFGRENAALRTLLEEALPSQDFFFAAQLINTVLEEPDTGLEGQANAVAQRMPALHTEWAEKLIDDGRFEAARETLESMTGLYSQHPNILTQIAKLRNRCELENVRELIRSGDPMSALRRLTQLSDFELELPVRHEIEMLVVDAVRHRAASLVKALDVPSLYRFLFSTLAEPGLTGSLQNQIRRIQADFDEQFFGFSVNRYARGRTPLIGTAYSGYQDAAILRIQNTTELPVTVQLVGADIIKVSVAAGRTEEVHISVGEYVEVSHFEREPKIAPYLAIHHFEPMEYQQVFKIDRTQSSVRSITGRST